MILFRQPQLYLECINDLVTGVRMVIPFDLDQSNSTIFNLIRAIEMVEPRRIRDKKGVEYNNIG